ncbi:Uncharacterised protein [Chlamydia abortus]|nr:Uncharacterised protein [Chlamydia abortus]
MEDCSKAKIEGKKSGCSLPNVSQPIQVSSPVVRVPVLSITIELQEAKRSKTTPPLRRTPCFAQAFTALR